MNRIPGAEELVARNEKFLKPPRATKRPGPVKRFFKDFLHFVGSSLLFMAMATNFLLFPTVGLLSMIVGIGMSVDLGNPYWLIAIPVGLMFSLFFGFFFFRVTWPAFESRVL